MMTEHAPGAGDEGYRTLFEANPHPMWVYDRETLAFLAVNDAAVAHYGYSRDEFLAMTIQDIRPREELPRLRENLAHPSPVLESSGVWKHRTKSGTVIDVQVSSHELPFGGRPARLVLAHDVTQRLRAEEEARRQREWLHVTLSSIGDAVIATDTAGRVMFMNRVAEALTGRAQGEAAGKPLAEVFRIVNEKSRLTVENPVSRVLRDGTVQGLANHTVLIARDGTERPIDDSAAPIRDPAGVTHGVVLVFHDVSERRELDRQLRERAEKLAEADRRKDEFLSMLAHELRNPLAPMQNALHVLRQRAGDPATVGQVREMMERQVGHLARLVDDLLDVSRITEGKIALRRERLDWARLVRAGVEDRRATLEAAGLHLTFNLPETPVWVNADPTRLAQVLDNLLDNARKFSPGGGRLGVSLTDVAGGTEAQLSVSDSGIGIGPETLPHLFEFFVQADRSLDRSRGGLGLGLALVKGLVELHGGRVGVASEGVGRGAAFTVALPREKELPALTEKPVRPAPPRQRLRVLVVEDNQDAAESLRMLLDLFGYEVAVAHTGPAGVDAAGRARPDVVLCDIGLPGMDGYAVASTLRQNPSTAAVRLIAVTGYGRDEDRRRALAAGFDEHLVKPVDPDDLLGRLAHAGAGGK